MLRQKSPGGPLVSLTPEDAKPPPSPEAHIKRGSKTKEQGGGKASGGGIAGGGGVMREGVYEEEELEDQELAQDAHQSAKSGNLQAAQTPKSKEESGVQRLVLSSPNSQHGSAAPSSVRGGFGFERTTSGHVLGPEQKEQETRSHALMSDWLLSMPPTTPFHRGHVLIVAESAYKQKKVTNKKGSQSARGPSRDKDEGGDAPNSARRAKEMKDQLYVYETPSQKRIKQENSKLHDTLQHSQAQLVYARTRAHRMLDGDRMDRTEIAKQKHQLLLERRQEAKKGSKVSSRRFQTGSEGSQSSLVRKSWPVSDRGDISRAASSVQESPSSPQKLSASQKVSPVKPSPRASEQAKTSWQAEKVLEGEGGEDTGIKSPHGLDSGGGSRGKDRGNEKAKGEEKKGEEKKEARVAFHTPKGQDKELLDLPGFLELVQTGGAELQRSGSRSTNGGGGVPRIQSPHSISAMMAQGLVEEDLMPRDMNEFFELNKRERAMVVSGLKRLEGVTIAAGDVVLEHVERLFELDAGHRGRDEGGARDKMLALKRKLKDAKMRCKFEEDSRRQLIEALEEQRGRRLRAKAVLVTHSGGEQPDQGLVAFGQMARAAFVSGGKVGGKVGPGYVEETALAVLEKARLRQNHMDEIERSRTEMEVKGGIAMRDSIHDLEEKTEESEAKRGQRLAAMQEHLRETRSVRMREASARVALKHQRQKQEFEDLMERRGERMEVAHERLHVAREKIADRAREGALIAQMKHERFVRKTQMTLRALDNRARELEQREESSHVGVNRIAAEKYKVQKESEAQRLRLMEKRTKVRNLVDLFRETGEFRLAQEEIVGLEEIEQLVDLNSSAVGNLRENFVDRNKAAAWLPRNQEVTGSVFGDSYKFFKIRQANNRSRITIILHALEGECELVIGNGDCETPTREAHTWSATNLLQKKITIHPFDKGFMLGMLYIGVYGASQHCKFDLVAKWKDDAEGFRGPSRRSTQNGRNTGSARREYEGFASDGTEGQGRGFEDEDELEENEEEGGWGASEEESYVNERGLGESAPKKPMEPKPGQAADVRVTEEELKKMSWVQVAAWLESMDISPEVIEKMETVGVTGERLAQESPQALKDEFEMSSLQAKRIALNIIKAEVTPGG